MAKLSQIVASTCAVDVYSGARAGYLTVDYRPSRFQQEFLAEVEAIQNDPEKSDIEKLEANTKWIMQMVPSWNVEAEDSTEKHPRFAEVTPEAVKALGLLIQGHIIKAISEDIERGN
jgi:hypothetical protein